MRVSSTCEIISICLLKLCLPPCAAVVLRLADPGPKVSIDWEKYFIPAILICQSNIYSFSGFCVYLVSMLTFIAKARITSREMHYVTIIDKDWGIFRLRLSGLYSANVPAVNACAVCMAVNRLLYPVLSLAQMIKLLALMQHSLQITNASLLLHFWSKVAVFH